MQKYYSCPRKKYSATHQNASRMVGLYFFKLYHKRFEELLEMVNEVTFKKVDDRFSLLQKKKELTDSKIIHTTHEQLAK